MVRVSVVIPTFDRRDLLSDAIRSLREQTFDSFECIIVDDGSTDGTKSYLENLDDDWLSTIRHDQSLGQSSARNAGVERSSGEYVVFLDSDDLLYPHAVDRLVTAMDERPSGCAGAFAAKRILTRNDQIRTKRPPTGSLSEPTLENARSVGGLTGTIFLRHTLEEVGGFDESLPARVDLDLYLSLLKQYDLVGIDDVCSVRRLHADQLSLDRDRVREAYRALVAKHRLGDSRLDQWRSS